MFLVTAPPPTLIADNLWLFQGVAEDGVRRHLARLEEPSPFDGSRLRFSQARRSGVQVVAVDWDMPVGVDLELVTDGPPAESVVREFFSITEGAWLDSLTPRGRAEGFLRLWTAKEALLKASGERIEELGEPDFADVLQRSTALAWSPVTLAFRQQRWRIAWYPTQSVLGPTIIARASGLSRLFGEKRAL